MEALQSVKPDSPLPSDSSSSSSSEHAHSQSNIKIEDEIAVEIVRTNSKADVEANAQVLKPSIPPDFPEGGLRAWLTVLGGTMVTFCTFGVVQSFGVYQDYYTRNSLSERSASEISLIGSLQVFFVFAIGLPAGRLFDAGYFHHCLLSGSAIYIFSIFMLSLVQPHHYYQNVLAQGIGMGLGMGLMFIPSLTVTSHYFRVKRSIAMGFVIAGSSIGGVVYPILLNNVFSRASGFPWGVRAVAFMDLGLLIIANSIMRTRLPPKSARGRDGEATIRSVLTDIPFIIYAVGAFLVFWGVFVPFFYLQLYAALHGVNSVFTKYSITVMNAASIFGRTVPNFVADYYVIIPSGLISAGMIFGMFGATSVAGVTAFAVFYGFFTGGLISLVAPAVGSFVTQRDQSDLGMRIGILSFLLAFALLTGNPLAGALLTSHHLWHRPLIFAAISVFCGAACHILIGSRYQNVAAAQKYDFL
ncbi:major facilitator superfamily domain-containing protein [Pholiota molesta]|nr:major facilitator superfamily domain-containing protein [Pholiota molesta]